MPGTLQVIEPDLKELSATLPDASLPQAHGMVPTRAIEMALALGAKAVFIGRPYIYGLTLGGAKGVERAISILRDELERAMALTGRRSIAEIDGTVLWHEQGVAEKKVLRSPAAGA